MAAMFAEGTARLCGPDGKPIPAGHKRTTVSEEGGDARDAAGLLDRSLVVRGDRQAGLGLALAHLYLAEAEDLSGAKLLAHRKAGLDALRAWPHQGSEPPEVTSARARLSTSSLS